MLSVKIINITIVTLLTTVLSACGSGGGDSTPPPPPVPTSSNNAPSISDFAAEVSTSNTLRYTFSWAVSDADNDSLTCSLSSGDGSNAITINDCAITTSSTIDYSVGGDFQASLTVTDPSNDSVSSIVDITVEATSNGLPLPSVFAGENQLIIFYNRPDGVYTDWVLHLWNNTACDSYLNADTEWLVGQAQSGMDDNYGAYWIIDLKPGYGDCGNFIVHKGDEKDLGGLDQRADLTGVRMIWTLQGISDIYSEATAYPSGTLIADVAAHWANENTVFWNAGGSANADVAKVRIYSSDVDNLAYDGETGIPGNNFLEYLPSLTSEHPAVTLSMLRYQNLAAFSSTSADIAIAKQMLKGKLLAISYADDDTVIAATYVQTPRILDALYAPASNSNLGVIYANNAITTNLWAPTATSVTLNIYNAAKVLQSSNAMVADTNTGVWSFDAPETMDRLFYRFELTVFHHQNTRFETIEATDPYSLSLSTNGSYSQFVNLADDDLKPIGWDAHIVPVVEEIEDAVIYEGHVRDFSVRDTSTSEANRGKYLAFTEQTSAPVLHLTSLVDAGMTHFQLLPVNDIASIGEDPTSRINLNNTVSELCAQNSSSPVCGVEDGNAILVDVYASYDPTTTDAQALTQSMRNLDSFNWGYDPEHFTTPDGSYSSNPDGAARILELRALNQSLHEMGLRVILDVVYNHTSSSGLNENSVLDKVVPGYYHRRDLMSGNVETATCCQDTAPEHMMMDKLMVDSLLTWTSEYKFDGFRFDIMGNNSKESILAARDAVQAIDPDNYFYGEGWTRADRGYVQASQVNMAGSEVGTFNDRPRDIIRNAALFKSTASLNEIDIIRLGLAGTLADYQLQDQNGVIKAGSTFGQSSYANDPADIINYVSKHDGDTLWDRLQYNLEDVATIDDRVRIQNIAGTLPLVSQGISFFQLGGDLLRSKSMDRNSYDAGDWFNYLDFTKMTNNWNVGLPLAQDNEGSWSAIGEIINNTNTSAQASDIEFSSDIFKEFIAIRASSKLFRLTTLADVTARLGFHNTGIGQTKGLIVMSLDDGTGLVDLDPANDAIVVVVNGTSSEQSHSILTAAGFELHASQQASADISVQTASFLASASEGTFTVPALTTAVFVKPQGADQGDGLAANATLDAPDPAPFGSTTAYLRGTMNNWGDSGLSSIDEFTFEGNGVYALNYSLAAATYTFKIGSSDWTDIDLGFNEVTFGLDSIMATDDGSGNISITIDVTGNYKFTLDASSATPILTITARNETVDCTALVDSVDPIPFSITGGGQLYVRGDHSAWNATEEFRLHYKGNNQYQAVAAFDGAMQFKLASDDGSWTTQLWVRESSSNTIETANLELGVNYRIAYENAGTDNNSANLAAGNYSFLLTLDSADPATGFDVGDLVIQQCNP
ncbi:MAG: pullulanase [Gammaproteobacteria bacterium]|nr:MAG: pullulanase [Gammaproteobacteria bacterium]